MKRIIVALALSSFFAVPAFANPFSFFGADESEVITIDNVCERAFTSTNWAEYCWGASGSSSKQFGSEGGSDGEGGDGEGGGESPQ
jgi:hypothetical protein